MGYLARHYAGRASNWDLIRAQEEAGFDAMGLDMFSWKLFQEVAAMPEVKVILSEHPRGAEVRSMVHSHIFA